MIIDFNDLVRYDKREIEDENSYDYKYREKFPLNVFKKSMIKNTVQFLPYKYDRKLKHPERNFLFVCESITAMTPNGQIFVMGGLFQHQYQKLTYSLKPQLRSSKINSFQDNYAPFEEYSHLCDASKEDSVQFFRTDRVRDMKHAKSNFGHFTTNQEVFIAGGTNSENYSLNQVESYDIKSDVWVKQPDLNFDRRSPSMCIFRNRFLYVFGGTQLKDKVKEEEAPNQVPQNNEDEESDNFNDDLNV